MDADAVESALEGLRKGKTVIVVDDDDREGEGDFVIAAERATAEHINFITKHGRGLVCVSLEKQRLRELRIQQMVSEEKNTAVNGCKFAVSVDYRKGTTTGISASDRAATIRALVDRKSSPEDFLRPGHVFPLQAEDGGVLKRPGHTEAAVDLARLAGLYPAGVICEIMADDGRMAKKRDLLALQNAFGLKMITIAGIVAYRLRAEQPPHREAQV